MIAERPRASQDPRRLTTKERRVSPRADTDDPLAATIDVGAREYSAHLPSPKVLSADQLADLTMPVYIGLGGLSSLASGSEAADNARAHLPDATTTVWPGTTHSLPLQVPDALDAATPTPPTGD